MISAGLGGSDDTLHLAVLRVFTSRNGSVFPSMIQKDVLRRLVATFYVLQFSTFILCLTCYSYRVRELLVCWLFFCFLSAVLAIAILGALLVCYAGQYLLNWVGAANKVLPDLVVCLAEIPQEASSAPRIIVAGTLEAVAVPMRPWMRLSSILVSWSRLQLELKKVSDTEQTAFSNCPKISKPLEKMYPEISSDSDQINAKESYIEKPTGNFVPSSHSRRPGIRPGR